MKLTSLTIVAVLFTLSAGRRCQQSAEELYRLSQEQTVTADMLARAGVIIGTYGSKNCLKDGVVVNAGGKRVETGTAVYLYGTVCLKSDTRSGVDRFIEYRAANLDSPNEEFAFCIERLFARRPGDVLEKIASLDERKKTELLDDVVWGFLSNHSTGYVQPVKRQPGAPRRLSESVGLSVDNCKNIFYGLNADLITLVRTYPEEIGYILRQIQGYLETWGGAR